MSYVDGFVIPVPKKNYKAYVASARKMAKAAKELGALQYVECVGDEVPVGKVTSFPRGVKLKSDEVVVFSFVVYRNKAHRNRVMKQMMADPRLASLMDPKTMPFDGRRMIWGGFKPIVGV